MSMMQFQISNNLKCYGRKLFSRNNAIVASHLNLAPIPRFCSGASLSQNLWNETEKKRKEALNTKFIRGLRDGNLDPTSFGTYMVQDVLYCHHSKQVIDRAMAKTKDTELKTLLEDLSRGYYKYTEALKKEWHIKDPDGITRGTSCYNYVHHLYDVANKKDPIYLVTAMTPRAKLWPWLGNILNAGTGNFGVYTEWVKKNLSKNCHHGIEKKYDAMLDLAEERELIDRQSALDVYSKSMDGEVAFFSLDRGTKPSNIEWKYRLR